ncbi:LANO_0C07360g1_1 [Lachancea nothofagi CBS 11611]|uniref:LANO_0C07360g1_1 n=1 Tax=Lachancea nothofagi CBS 11611 TaxID=1266666 RepID=A0A1G4J8P7_9SACH|nr:LANO_0C07360g1_1 [Lachancea nothofagi CBS 11611]
MRNHRVDTQKVAENVKLEVIYESNPCFAGESIQVLIRLRHLGSSQTRDQLIEEKLAIQREREGKVKEAEGATRAPWSVQSLWGSFNRDQRAQEEKENARVARLDRSLQFHDSVSLTSCYVQIYGLFQYDPEILNQKSFEHSVHHKLAGMGPLKISAGKGSAGEGFASLLFANLDDVARESVAESSVELVKVPTLLVPQTLVFSEILLEPGQTRTFQFKSPRLLQELTPSYQTSKQLKIQYFLNFGLTEMKQDKINPFNADFPIHLCPFIDTLGRQFTSTLDADISIMTPGRVKEIKDSQRSRRKSNSSLLLRRKSSLVSVSSLTTKKEAGLECKNLFKKLVVDHASSAELADGIEGLVDKMMECQFGVGNYDTSEEEDGDITKDQSQASVRKDAVSVRDNLNVLFRDLPDMLHSDEKTDNEHPSESADLLPQLKNLQKEYIINRNGVFVAKVALSSPFYTTSDDLDFTIHLNTEETHKISAVTASLKSFELVNPKFSTETSLSNTKQQGKTMDECRAICFEDTTTIHMKLLPQKSPNNQMTSQFKTDIFQFKWMLCLRFVLIDRLENKELLEVFYEDKNGSLLHAKQSLDGEEFVCHLPLTILPTAKNFAGW